MPRKAFFIAALTIVSGAAAGGPLASGMPVGASLSMPQEELRTWIRSPAYAPDGRLAFEAHGDIWVSGLRRGAADLRPDRIVRVTEGADWDRDPTWAPDGSAIVFASDRDGATNLWRIEIDRNGRPGGTSRVTAGEGPDTQPTVGADGRIVFVRGRYAGVDLWVRTTEGDEELLKPRDGVESSPAFSPAGDELLYISNRELRVLSFVDGAVDEDESVVTGLTVAQAAWAPDGERLVVAASGGSPGVYITPRDGRFRNVLIEAAAWPAWSPDGERIALAELQPAGPGYNGDPDRLGDRAVGDVFAASEDEARFWLVDAPQPFVTEPVPVEISVRADREEHNAEAFDRVWSRLATLYYDDDGRAAAWQQLREQYRPRAVAAASEAELEGAIDAMLRDRPTAHDEVSGRAAVSSAHPIATAAGVEILEAGGNVVDAAVAVSFALSVVEPDASGLGGYGQMVLYLTSMEKPVVIEFLTRAPEAATLDNGALDNPTGPMLANVPGVPRGMELAFERYGSGDVEWSSLLAPAIHAAEEGYVLDDAFTTTLALERDRYERWESSTDLFFRDGEPLKAGDVLENPDQAWALREIAEGGADAFYEGEIARRMVEDLRGKGNAMTMRDMARYFAVERPAVEGEYRGHTIYGAAPPVSGGVSLLAKLHLLDNLPGLGLFTEDTAALHALIEASKLQPSSRGRLADPGLWPVDIAPVIDRDAAARRWAACFDASRATGPDDLESGRDGMPACAEEQDEVASLWGEDIFSCEDSAEGCRSTGTTAFAVGDAAGNFVAVTQTLGTWGGNFYVTPGLGFLYNDKLRSYGSDPTGYGARLPYARNGTSISPTLVFRGTGAERRPFLAVGAAGNAWIGAAVYAAITGIVDGGLGPQRALELPRILVGGRAPARPGGGRRTVIQAEDIISPRVIRELRAMGHEFQMISLRGEMRMGYGAAVMIDEGRAIGGADPRRSGAAGAAR